MVVRFWGVRGSIASPGESTLRYGGNTSCVSVHFGSGSVLVLDAGTGIRQLGNSLGPEAGPIFVLVSHGHWDHIQGFPFFAPIYQPEREVYMFPSPQGKEMICSLVDQMDGAHFPVKSEDLAAQPECVIDDPMGFLGEHGVHVTRIATNHPGGGFGYRVEDEGRSLVYLTDNELDPPYAKANRFEDFVAFCQGADLLIHDAQYLESDMPRKHGWGHSLVGQACELAAAAQVRRLALYHHDPDRSDDELDAIQARAREWFRENAPAVECHVAAEGEAISLSE